MANSAFSGDFKPRESDAEINSRIQRENAKAEHTLWKEKAVLIATLVGVAIVVLFCLYVAIRPDAPEDKKWAMSIMASIVSGGVGYLAGGRGKSSE